MKLLIILMVILSYNLASANECSGLFQISESNTTQAMGSWIYKSIEQIKNYKSGEILSIAAELKLSNERTDYLNAKKIDRSLSN